VSHSGTTTSDANFVHPDSAAKKPRLKAEVVKRKPKIRKAGTIASFVFELDAYCVNG
jgi:hypothetical protein